MSGQTPRPIGTPRRHAFRNGVIGETPISNTKSGHQRKSSFGSGFPNIKKIRPMTPDSLASDDSDKLTKDQHICIQNMGMAAAFFLPIALIGAAVSIGTNYWFNVEGHYVGMFVFCNNWTQECGGISELYGNHTFLKNIWTYGVPLEVGGASMLLLGMLTLVCYPCHRRVNFSKICCGIFVGLILLLGLFAFLGGTGLFMYFHVKESPSPGLEWSFYLNGGSAVFAFIAVILFWIHVFYTGCFDMD